jgi:hypothetical protein
MTEQDITIYKFLMELQESGKTNMFGAAPYIVRRFKLTLKKADEYLLYFLENYEKVEELIKTDPFVR